MLESIGTAGLLALAGCTLVALLAVALGREFRFTLKAGDKAMEMKVPARKDRKRNASRTVLLAQSDQRSGSLAIPASGNVAGKEVSDGQTAAGSKDSNRNR